MMTHMQRTRTLRTLTAAAVISFAGATASAQSGNAYIPSHRDVGQAVHTELMTAPEVSSYFIDIANHSGVITLTGTVPTLLDKWRAAEVTETVRGVRTVVNRLRVTSVERPDKQIASDSVRALATDPAADAYELKVRVDDGTARLSGSVDSWHERELAARVARSVRGVKEVVIEEVELEPVTDRPDAEIRADVRSRLRWDRWIDDPSVEVEVEDGRVTLRGSVASAAEKRRASVTGWVAGVTHVDTDSLEVHSWTKSPNERTPDDVARLRDSEIEQAIHDAMAYDPRVLSEEIEASCSAGMVTLTGKVDNLRAKRAAAQDARNTAGVWRVRDFITVRPVGERRVGDDLRSHVLEVIERDPIVWRDGKYVRLEDSTVYLMGDARSTAESDRAVEIVSTVPGVVAVVNRLDTSDEWEWKADDELADDVQSQLFWSPFVDSTDIAVEADNGVVTLTGEVEDWAEMAAARENAWDADPKAVYLDLDITGS